MYLETPLGCLSLTRLSRREFRRLRREHRRRKAGLARAIVLRAALKADPALDYGRFARLALALTERQVKQLAYILPYPPGLIRKVRFGLVSKAAASI